MTLYRAPKKGEFLYYEKDDFLAKTTMDWTDNMFRLVEDRCSIVNPVGYINVFKTNLGRFLPGIVYPTREEADKAAKNVPNRIACMRIVEGVFNV